MQFTSTFISLLSAVLLVQAKGGNGGCPAIWNQISSMLSAQFVDPTTGQCTDLARGAIRMSFHDSCTFALNVPCNGSPACGGADASLMLVPGEIDRPENGGLLPYWTFINNFYTSNNLAAQNVSAADLLYFAGNVGVISCPLGPVVKTVVGRKSESVIPSPTGLMPNAFGPGSDAPTLVTLFENKGFSEADLAALVGAHTASRAFAQEPNVPFGNSQDDTPGIWDVDFYSNTYNPPALSTFTRFDSDINLSLATTDVGKEFKGFVNNQGKWGGKYADAFYRMSILGIPASVSNNFVDCTNALPQPKGKRSFSSMPRNNRAR